MRTPSLAGLTALTLWASLAGAGAPQDNASLADRGRQVYADNCAACHGTRGDGRGMAAHMFRTQPRDLRSGVFKFRSTPSGTLPTDADLLRTLEAGVRTTAMIAQRHLPEDERRTVVAYLKTLSPRFAEEGPGEPITIPAAPPVTADLVERGARIYVKAQCWECHGREGKGDGPSAGQLKDDWGMPIRPTDLTRLPYKGGQALEDLYRTIATGLDGTPMPSYEDSLAADEIWALVAYLRTRPRASAWKNLDAPAGEERAGIMVERMHGTLGGGMMRRGPMMPR